MEAAHDLLGEQHLGVARITALGALLLELGDLGVAAQAQQVVPVPHQRVGDGHHLAEHVVRSVGDADVVVLALAHLDLTVKTNEKRHRQDALGLLTVLALEFATDQKIEFLVGSAQLQIGFQRN